MQINFSNYIQKVISSGASDIHFSEERVPYLRVDGNLVPMDGENFLSHEDIVELLKVFLPEDKRIRFEEHQEVDFAYDTQNVRFRGNAYVQQGKIGIALRYIPRIIRTLAELELPDVLADFTRLRQGFFLVVGPVGQGKTTTLASMVDIINHERADHIITIEDPIEYLFNPNQALIEQREVGSDTRNFHTGLQSALRQDVDVLLVGEMRDPDTISAAITAAETGHLVFSTLHTNNAAQTIDRIIDSFSAENQNQVRSQLSLSLTGILSQRLVPRNGGGMVMAYELLINNNAISNLIREGRVHEISSVVETSSEFGMVSMNRSLANLVHEGKISEDVALSRSLDPESLHQIL